MVEAISETVSEALKPLSKEIIKNQVYDEDFDLPATKIAKTSKMEEKDVLGNLPQDNSRPNKMKDECVLADLPPVYSLPNVQQILNSIWIPGYSGEKFIRDLERCLEEKMYLSFAYYVIDSSVQVLGYNKRLLENVRILFQRASEEAHDEIIKYLKSRIRLLVLLTDADVPRGVRFYPSNEEHIRKVDHLSVAINVRYFRDLPIVLELEITDKMLERVEIECADVSPDGRRREMIALRDAV